MQREIFERIGRESAGRAEERQICPRRELAALSDALREIRARVRKAPPERPGPTLAWILDNAALAEREGAAALRALRRAEFTAAGENTAVGELCRALVRCGAEALSEAEIGCAVDAYTAERFLPEEELALLPDMLRAHIVIYTAEVWKSIDGIAEREGKYQHGISRALKCLHALQGGMLQDIVLSHDPVERILMQDPEGLYPRLDVPSRALLRACLRRKAKREGVRPDRMAWRILSAGEPVRWLANEAEPRPRLGRMYFAALISVGLAFFLIFCLAAKNFAAAGLFLLPAAAAGRAVCDFLALRLVPPRGTLRLDLSDGIPEDAKTLCVITSLITKPGDARELGGRLREFAAANRNCGENLYFGLLLDFKDAPKEVMPEDDVLRREAEDVVRELRSENGRYFLFLRERKYAATEARFMGAERKRGALAALFDRLRGTGDLPVFGEGLPEDIRYVLTLDSDTRAEPYSILPLVAALACPVNRPVIREGRVVSGYGMAMPRIVTDITAAHRSTFARLTGGNGGCDPYGSVMSDLYMDLFGEASFTGKGLIDVDAYRSCLSQLPEGRILSHDLLESGYLRCALQNDVEMTDGCPHRAVAYYSRLRRWIRGDIQIAAWMFRRIPGRLGERLKNPLSALTKYKIFDNLRRAATAPALLAVFLYGAFYPSGEKAILVGCVCIALPELLGALAGEMGRGERAWRYHSSVAAGLGAGIFSAFVQLWFLPVQAACSLSAGMSAIRGLRTGKGMLAWVTAAEADAVKRDDAALWRLCFPSVALGAVCLSGNGGGILLGLLWLLTPVCAAALSAPCGEEISLSERDASRLKEYAREIWQYFADLLRPEDHYLIPDNLQEEPSVGVAHRTSPTDVGFGIAAVICAVDLGFTAPEEGLGLLSGQIEALERQKKWRGHIYNWVDTRTLRPLPPYCISTVDSGNLAAALLLCSIFCAERGNEFAGLGVRARAIFDGMDFSALYDTRRDLFSIGAYTTENRRMEGCYDLLASEARLTGFIAAAFGHAGEKFWGRLGRGLVGYRGFAGLASWTGSMFEYLMPELFLPRFDNSLVAESAAFCVAAQRRHRPAGTSLWGTSESGYRAFDRGMSYQYKAHGVPRLALKRGMGRDAVLSPYSVFLALPYSPRAAMCCLSGFERLGLRGRYGLYEAADFTASRTGGRTFEPVASYMAHHMGMSLMSLHLLLTRGKNPQRMMKIPELSAYAGLLKERLPVGGVIMQRREAEVPERDLRGNAVIFAKSTAGNFADPEGCLMANDAYTLIMDERGLGSAFYEGKSVYRAADDRLSAVGGVRAFLVTERESLEVASLPIGDEVKRRCIRCENAMTVECTTETVSLIAETCVARNNAAEIRDYRIVNRSGEPLRGQLILCFEPLLCPMADHEAHPTYRRLFLRTESAGGAVLVTRRDRGNELWLSFALLCPEAEIEYETSRETLIGRRGYDPRRMVFAGGFGDVLDPCVAARANVTVPAGGDVSLRAVISVARERSAALQALQSGKSPAPERADLLLRGVMRKMSPEHHAEAQRLAARLLFEPYGKGGSGLPEGGFSALWRLGIAGDVPLLLSRNRMDGSAEVFPIFCFAMYRRAGIACELAVLTDEGDTYLRPGRDAVLDAAAEFGLTEASGIYVIDRSMLKEGDLALLRAAAVLDFAENPKEIPALAPRKQIAFAPGRGAELPVRMGDLSSLAPQHMPPVSWSMPLAGRRFGCIAQDVGPGGMWYRNARLFRVTGFSMDPLGGSLEERMCLSDGVHTMSLFKEEGEPCGMRFDLGCAVWEKQAEGIRVKTRMFCPPDIPARVVLVEGYAERDVTLSWFLRPLLGERRADRIFLQAHPTEDGAVVENTAGRFFVGTELLCLASGDAECTCYAPHAWSEWKTGAAGFGGDALLYLRLAPVRGKFSLVLVAGVREDEKGAALRALLEVDAAERAMEETRAHFAKRVCALRPETPDAALDAYISAPCLYQVLASRLYARASLWQCGGGNGFRDQLQDICAILPFDAPLARQTILTACARQYEEGDVMHWWHDLPGGCMGVRTRYSDDLLWLPYAVFEYVNVTGDRSLLSAEVPYLASPPLEDGEKSRCERPPLSTRRESVLSHCIRACEMVAERGVGAHGLPLMLGGDWNDGMDLVGAEGRGESVWLGFFAAHVFRRTAHLCRRADMRQKAEELTFFARSMAASALQARAGGAYIRAWWDDGTPLGNGAGECALDSIAQSFSLWVPEGDPTEKRAAVRLAAEGLWDREYGLIRLLTPPFAGKGKDPGYISDYPPGIRENGGQYTHAAVWLCMACFAAGEEELGFEMLMSLLPAKRREEIRKTEDFVLTGDVYDHPLHRGRGGWSWYTGAAGWYMQAVMYCLFGLRFSDGALSFFPYLPKSWERYSFELDLYNVRLRVQVRRGGTPGVYLNGDRTDNEFHPQEMCGEADVLVIV
ncbi:MAG: hypothetical protein IKT60_01070 [Clostridia bacterium]|nr:hypothetical protein [Clostridia bacterium]